MKWIRKYPVLAAVGVLAGSAVAESLGHAEIGSIIRSVGALVGIAVPDPATAQATGDAVKGVMGAIASLGLLVKLLRDRDKAKNLPPGGDRRK